MAELREKRPEVEVTISLIPCQFAGGNEAGIARGFGADTVTAPADFLRFLATGHKPAAWRGEEGFVLSMGGNTGMALQLAQRLRYPGYRYSFNPYWHRRLKRLFVHDRRAARNARLLGAPGDRVEIIGNLVADAVQRAAPVARPGRPHVLLIPGSRDGFALHLIPFMIALADRLGALYPEARFVWPVSRLLSSEVIRDGIAGREKATLGGATGVRQYVNGREVIATPSGHLLEMISEDERYAHMRSADLAVTIPGTNTLELGIAGVPSVVVLPLNKPEAIPLEGPGHWLSLVPIVGTALKRQAVLLAAPHFPVALPNELSGEKLMLEITGKVGVARALDAVRSLLDHPEDLKRRRDRLGATMPQPGAAKRLVSRIFEDLEGR
ncbi:MAG: hypothetical protein M3511_15920 [Deinococcota bacterium]|nr:hypothetical protein [Deinococcota bacterium]